MATEPYYPHVPKDMDRNIAFRKELLEWATGNEDAQHELRLACMRDILFWWNAFLFTFDPRKRITKIPFITFACQDEAIRRLCDAIYCGRDQFWRKSRDMGASYINTGVPLWFWLYQDMFSALVVSRNEDYVDKTDNPKSLFWKIDFMLKHLPAWMRPDVSKTRTHMHLLNPENGSVIDGESTTADVGTGDRRTVIFLDEFSLIRDGKRVDLATADVAPCRVFNGTPKGTGNHFYTLSRRPDLDNVVLHWRDHPEKGAGLYTSRNGVLEILDTDYQFPPDYPFVLDTTPGRIGGVLRSPAYDAQAQRRGSSRAMAQEWDIDFLGAGDGFFDGTMLDEYKRENCRPPVYAGDIELHPETHRFKGVTQPMSSGAKFLLWRDLDSHGCLPDDRDYVVGVDVAAGSTDESGRGASNSSIAIWDKRVREKVGEYTTHGVDPYQLARIAYALCMWLRGPMGTGFLIWDAGGPGLAFWKEIRRLEYGRIWYRRDEQNASAKVTNKPGFFMTKNEKHALLSDYSEALAEGLVVNRSEDSINEAYHYVLMADGRVVHAASEDTEDPSGARDNHGDRVIADALAVRVLGLRDRPQQTKDQTPPPNSFAARREAYLRSRRELAHSW